MARNKADGPKRRSETTLDNKVVRQENKIQLRELEKMYVYGVIDNLDEIVAEKKEEIVGKLKEFYLKLEQKPEIRSPYLINSYFFKSINPMPNHEPKYTAEKLGIVWELYQDILTEVNMNIGEILPSLSSFCKFAGITLVTFKNYKSSPDEGLRILVEKINDECFDSQVTMAQNGLLKERSTIYRMKAEQERIEKETPAIHIHENTVDVGSIVNRLKEIKQFNDKKGAIEVEGGTEYEQ
jgi:hypothetical protein